MMTIHLFSFQIHVTLLNEYIYNTLWLRAKMLLFWIYHKTQSLNLQELLILKRDNIYEK